MGWKFTPKTANNPFAENAVIAGYAQAARLLRPIACAIPVIVVGSPESSTVDPRPTFLSGYLCWRVRRKHGGMTLETVWEVEREPVVASDPGPEADWYKRSRHASVYTHKTGQALTAQDIERMVEKLSSVLLSNVLTEEKAGYGAGAAGTVAADRFRRRSGCVA